MILDVFKYYARFPKRDGVLSAFNNGSSSLPAYAQLKTYVESLPEQGILPEIEHLVFGQSLDEVRARIDSITGTYLFVDFGEFNSNRDQRNSILDVQKLAVTVATKTPTAFDLVEESIISDSTLLLINKLRAHLIADSEKYEWLRFLSNKHDIMPFVAPELGESIGWTLMYSLEGSDLFDVKALIRSFNQSL